MKTNKCFLGKKEKKKSLSDLLVLIKEKDI